MADIVIANNPQGSLRKGLCESVKSLLKSAAAKLKGSIRRQFIAETVTELGPGGQSIAERELGWNRGTIRFPPNCTRRGSGGELQAPHRPTGDAMDELLIRNF